MSLLPSQSVMISFSPAFGRYKPLSASAQSFPTFYSPWNQKSTLVVGREPMYWVDMKLQGRPAAAVGGWIQDVIQGLQNNRASLIAKYSCKIMHHFFPQVVVKKMHHYLRTRMFAFLLLRIILCPSPAARDDVNLFVCHFSFMTTIAIKLLFTVYENPLE